MRWGRSELATAAARRRTLYARRSGEAAGARPSLDVFGELKRLFSPSIPSWMRSERSEPDGSAPRGPPASGAVAGRGADNRTLTGCEDGARWALDAVTGDASAPVCEDVEETATVSLGAHSEPSLLVGSSMRGVSSSVPSLRRGEA